MKCAQFTTVGFHRDYLDLGFCFARKRKKRKKSHEPRLRPKLPAGRRKRSFRGPLSRVTTDFVWLLIKCFEVLIIIPGSTAVAIPLVGNSTKNLKETSFLRKQPRKCSEKRLFEETIGEEGHSPFTIFWWRGAKSESQSEGVGAWDWRNLLSGMCCFERVSQPALSKFDG